jgi:hypothetical protein
VKTLRAETIWQSQEQKARTGYATLYDEEGEWVGKVAEMDAAMIVHRVNAYSQLTLVIQAIGETYGGDSANHGDAIRNGLRILARLDREDRKAVRS